MNIYEYLPNQENPLSLHKTSTEPSFMIFFFNMWNYMCKWNIQVLSTNMNYISIFGKTINIYWIGRYCGCTRKLLSVIELMTTIAVINKYQNQRNLCSIYDDCETRKVDDIMVLLYILEIYILMLIL